MNENDYRPIITESDAERMCDSPRHHRHSQGASMRDKTARRMALVAMMIGIGAGTMGSAFADSITEPDAYALRQTVLQQQDEIESMILVIQQQDENIDTLYNNDAIFDERTGAGTPNECLAYSDRHFFKERLDAGKSKHRFPIVGWNMAIKSCRPAIGPWKGRMFAPKATKKVRTTR